jgi:hypothetical protein
MTQNFVLDGDVFFFLLLGWRVPHPLQCSVLPPYWYCGCLVSIIRSLSLFLLFLQLIVIPCIFSYQYRFRFLHRQSPISAGLCMVGYFQVPLEWYRPQFLQESPCRLAQKLPS